ARAPARRGRGAPRAMGPRAAGTGCRAKRGFRARVAATATRFPLYGEYIPSKLPRPAFRRDREQMATAVPTAAAPAPAHAAPRPAEASAPLAPATIEETGLTSAFVADLTLKLLYQRATTAAELVQILCLPLKILQPVLDFCKTEHLVAV